MEKIKAIDENNRLSFSDDLIPYKYLSDAIKEYLSDINVISEIVVQNKDNKELVDFGERVKSELNSKVILLQTKLKNIPNPKYLEESDEEFVDKYM